MKKTVVLLLCLTLVFSSLVSCDNIQKDDSENNNLSNQSSNSDETTPLLPPLSMSISTKTTMICLRKEMPIRHMTKTMQY